MTNEEFLEMLEASIHGGQKLVVSHGWAKDLIRLARKGLAAEKAVDDVRHGRLSASEALAAYEAATKEESK